MTPDVIEMQCAANDALQALEVCRRALDSANDELSSSVPDDVAAVYYGVASMLGEVSKLIHDEIAAAGGAR